MSKELEKFYEIFLWPENIHSEDGAERYINALTRFKNLVTHSWITSLLSSKDHLRVIDICGGTGIGGIAFAKVLKELGKNVELTIVDLRESALRKAEEFGKLELGFKPITLKAAVLKLHELNKTFDLCLMYGLSAPHFNPFQMCELLVSVSEILTNDGIFIMDEADRTYSIFFMRGYQHVLPEISKEKVVISLHKSYNNITGTFKRLIIDLLNKNAIEMDMYFWNLAELMAMAWLLFNDIDFMKDKERPYAGFIIIHKPRKNINANDLINMPTILRNTLR
ncbi:MAG: methyltransferase domain-containing protein [Thermoprotei archaeon]